MQNMLAVISEKRRRRQILGAALVGALIGSVLTIVALAASAYADPPRVHSVVYGRDS